MGSYNESRKGNMSRETLLVVVEATLNSLGWNYQISGTDIFQISFPVNLWSFGETLKIETFSSGEVKAECKGSNWGKNIKIVKTFLAQLEKMYLIIEAKINYQASLEQLKVNPTNPEVREETLKVGRLYVNLARAETGITAFDELAMMNDINAACARSFSEQNSIKPTASQTIEERLISLNNLKESNLIDEQEYITKRQKILDEM